MNTHFQKISGMNKIYFFYSLLLLLLISPIAKSQPENWKILQIKIPLSSISFVDSNKAYIYGNSIKWKTTNQGVSWQLEPNIPYYIGTSSPYSVYFSVVLSILFYYFIKIIWNDNMALFVTLLFPFYASWNYFGEITGDTLSEDLVEKIFSDFCIGK